MLARIAAARGHGRRVDAGTRPRTVLRFHPEYPLALGYAALAVRTLGAALDPKVLLGKAERRTLEVGFDSGDSMMIATLSA
jgi:hypothetical protein